MSYPASAVAGLESIALIGTLVNVAPLYVPPFGSGTPPTALLKMLDPFGKFESFTPAPKSVT